MDNPDHDWSDENYAAAEAAIQTVTDWLMAEGITGWLIGGLPRRGAPVEVQLYCECRPHAPRIQAHFGDMVNVTILPDDTPRISPLATPPPKPCC